MKLRQIKKGTYSYENYYNRKHAKYTTIYTSYFRNKISAVKTYRNKNSISFICRRYTVSKASLMRWNKKYNGTKASLMDKSHKPYSQHPNSHTSEELT